MKQEKYTSLWDFLIKTPKNLWSLITIWGMCIAGMVVSIMDIRNFDNGTVWALTMMFLTLIMFLGWYRVYLLYKKNK